MRQGHIDTSYCLTSSARGSRLIRRLISLTLTARSFKSLSTCESNPAGATTVSDGIGCGSLDPASVIGTVVDGAGLRTRTLTNLPCLLRRSTVEYMDGGA